MRGPQLYKPTHLLPAASDFTLVSRLIRDHQRLKDNGPFMSLGELLIFAAVVFMSVI